MVAAWVCTRHSVDMLWFFRLGFMLDSLSFLFFLNFIYKYLFPSFPFSCPYNLLHPISHHFSEDVRPPFESQQNLVHQVEARPRPLISKLSKVSQYNEWTPNSQFKHLAYICVCVCSCIFAYNLLSNTGYKAKESDTINNWSITV